MLWFKGGQPESLSGVSENAKVSNAVRAWATLRHREVAGGACFSRFGVCVRSGLKFWIRVCGYWVGGGGVLLQGFWRDRRGARRQNRAPEAH